MSRENKDHTNEKEAVTLIVDQKTDSIAKRLEYNQIGNMAGGHFMDVRVLKIFQNQ